MIRTVPDRGIEGLRALAILLVVGDHAGLPGMHGGFIGVDIFFVISGFLITRLLHSEWARHGTVDLLNFYARRFQRLLPALAFMLVSVSLLMTRFFPHTDLVFHAEAAIWSAFWASNIHFAWSDLDYFGQQAEDNAFLHTWSLGVEEQFYLVWPVLLLFVMQKSTAIPARVAWIMGIAALSFLCSLFVDEKYVLHTFYQMPFRVWQFSVGAITCFVLMRGTAVRSNIFAGVGIAMIFASLIVLNDPRAYSTWQSLAPTLGAALIIGTTFECSNTMAQALAWRPLQLIGKTSYSWYLWHWPVLILGELYFGSPTLLERIVLACFSWVLAWATFQGVEHPVREFSFSKETQKIRLIFFLGLMMMLGFGLIRWQANEKSAQAANQEVLSAITDMPSLYRDGCDDWFRSDVLRPCIVVDGPAENTAVLAGDSVGVQWAPAFESIFKSLGWRLVVFTKSSCPMIHADFYYARIGRDYTECSNWKASLINEIRTLRPRMVILGSSQGYTISPEVWLKGATQLFEKLVPHTDAVHVIRPTPTLPFSGPLCLTGRREGRDTRNPCTSVSNAELPRWVATQRAARVSDKIHLVDMNDQVCPKGRCRARQGSVMVFRDEQHLTASFVKTLARPLSRRVFQGIERDAP